MSKQEEVGAAYIDPKEKALEDAKAYGDKPPLAAKVYHSGKTMRLKDAWSLKDYDRTPDEHDRYRPTSVLVCPIQRDPPIWMGRGAGQVVGVLELINHKDPQQHYWQPYEERWLNLIAKSFSRQYVEAYTAAHHKSLWAKYLRLVEMVHDLYQHTTNDVSFIMLLQDRFKKFARANQVSIFLKYKDFFSRLDFNHERTIHKREFQLIDSCAGHCARTGKPLLLNRQSNWDGINFSTMIDLEIHENQTLYNWPIMNGSVVSVVVQWVSSPEDRGMKLEGDVDLQAAHERLVITQFMKVLNPFIERFWPLRTRKHVVYSDRVLQSFRVAIRRNDSLYFLKLFLLFFISDF